MEKIKLIKQDESKCKIKIVFKDTVLVGNTDEYKGEYVVTPKKIEQVLETKEKLMKDNVTVKKIGYYETSNESDGLTVYIGE